MREATTGATRDGDDGKPDYEGFLSPLVLAAYGRYMHTHRQQADGQTRAADNWQKGMPVAWYRSSLIRHVVIAWSLWRGWPVAAERIGTETRPPTLTEALCAILFNTMGLIHEAEQSSAFENGSQRPRLWERLGLPLCTCGHARTEHKFSGHLEKLRSPCTTCSCQRFDDARPR